MEIKIEDLKTLSLEQMLVVGSYDLSTFEGKMKAISKSLETLDLPTEDDKRKIFEVVSDGVFAPDTGKYFVNTNEPIDDADGFISKGNFKNTETGEIEVFYGVESLEQATPFTKEELEHFPKKLRIYNNDAFVLPEYVARYKYDDTPGKVKYQKWVDSYVKQYTVSNSELEEETSEHEKRPKKMIASYGRAR